MRLTPLNILTSVCLVCVCYLLLFTDSEGWIILGSIPLLILSVLSFITDLIFRRFIQDLKRIWIIEILFIIFALVLYMLIEYYSA